MATHTSIPIEAMSDEDFGELVRGILAKELGPEGLVRYLKLVGDFDYTRDRHHWLDGVTVDDVLRESQKQA